MRFTDNQKEILKRKFDEIKKELIGFKNELVDRVAVKIPHEYLEIELILNKDYIIFRVGYMNYYIFKKGGLDRYNTVDFNKIYTLIYNWDSLKIKDFIEKQNSVFR